MSLIRADNRHLAKLADGHLAMNPDGFGCDPQDLADSYEIDGYVDGDLSAGGDCTACDSGVGPVWDGTFGMDRTDDGTMTCLWNADHGTSGTQTVDGKLVVNNLILINWQAVPCHWRLAVVCSKFGPDVVIWDGDKNSGRSPVGIYTRNIGCDTTSTLSVVEC